MQQDITIQLKPNEAFSNEIILLHIADIIGKPVKSITGFYPMKKSIDARSRQQIWVNLTVKVFIDGRYPPRKTKNK